MPSTRTTDRILRSRLVNALTYPYGPERFVEMIDPLARRNQIRAEITSVHHQTPKSVTLTLAPNHHWDGAEAGQFVGLTVEIDGRRETRPYSLAGSEHAHGGVIELTVSTHPEGLVSRYLRDHARPGMIVELDPAAGEFVMPRLRPRRILLVAGGSGITPVMAMLRTLRDEGHSGEIGFLRYARSPELALYDDELAEAAIALEGFDVATSYTQAEARGDGDLTGRFTAEHAEAVLPGLAADPPATFVCGPPALIDAVRATWADAGWPEPAVETFAPPQVDLAAMAAADGPVEGTISFGASGLSAENNGQPLLDQAEDAGLNPAHGCRMGICNTCSCTRTSGTTRNLLTGETSSRAGEQVRICVSVPVGDVELEL